MNLVFVFILKGTYYRCLNLSIYYSCIYLAGHYCERESCVFRYHLCQGPGHLLLRIKKMQKVLRYTRDYTVMCRFSLFSVVCIKQLFTFI